MAATGVFLAWGPPAGAQGGGSISGEVKFAGAAPAPKVVKVNKDNEVCGQEKKIADDRLRVYQKAVDRFVNEAPAIVDGHPLGSSPTRDLLELCGKLLEEVQGTGVDDTGLAVRGNTIYMAEAGPVPHLPKDGRVVAFGPTPATAVTPVASGSPLLVDVEFGRGRTLYALSQGVGSGGPPGSPALPDTGALVKVNGDGTFTTVADHLDRPTSLEFIGTTAYVVTLGGDIWKITGVSGPPYGATR